MFRGDTSSPVYYRPRLERPARRRRVHFGGRSNDEGCSWLGVLMKMHCRLGGRTLSRSLMVAAMTALVTLWSLPAMATITQGDFSVFGNLRAQWSGRFGEGGGHDNGGPTDFTNAVGHPS